MSLMVSISGIRGVIGESLSPEVIVKYTGAFSQYLPPGPVVVGRDGRITGKIIGNIVTSTLLSMGRDVIALGVVPTPTIALAVERAGASGGIAITASHNPMQWNGLKFIGGNGMFLTAEENRQFWEVASSQRLLYAQWNTIGNHSVDTASIQHHLKAVLGLPYINIEKIRARKFKIVVDCINAAGGLIVPKMLRDLGCTVVEMNCELSGVFAHPPEPIPEHLDDLCKRVVEEQADFGIAVDPDVDRLVMITEQGKPFGEEYTIAAVISFVLGHRIAPSENDSVVVNLSTTRAVDDIAGKHHVRVHRTAVGEINVATRMKEVGAIVGGEGSGGVIVPAVHYTRDAIVGIAILLQQMAEFDGTLSEFKSTLPLYSIEKSKVKISGIDPDAALQRVKQRFGTNGNVNAEDGLKIDFPDSWVHLRKSNTEPIIRIIAEAPTAEKARLVVEQFQKELL